MLDFHLHSAFSHDGKNKISEIIDKAKELGIDYIAITDHCDFDYIDHPRYWFFHQIRLKKYIKELTEAAKADGIKVAVGAELGYSKKATPRYLRRIPFDKLDYVLNSTHSADVDDVYFQHYFKNKSRTEAYETYLKAVEESISAPYPYCTVSHIGYVTKNAPYENPDMPYEEFPALFDSILKKIIAKGVSLEINSKVLRGGFMPHESIVRRYYELGGRKITFGSDAHRLDRIGFGYKEITEKMKEIGFTHWTAFEKMKPFDVEF